MKKTFHRTRNVNANNYMKKKINQIHDLRNPD